MLSIFPSQIHLTFVILILGMSKKKKKKPSKLSKKPGESTRQFFDRLDQQVGDALNKALMETKKLRERRKE